MQAVQIHYEHRHLHWLNVVRTVVALDHSYEESHLTIALCPTASVLLSKHVSWKA
jgi:hypothetical protein